MQRQRYKLGMKMHCVQNGVLRKKSSKRYGNASIIADNRVIFNIKGNEYRLVVKVQYDRGQIYIRFVGTHRAYDEIDAKII